MDFSSAAATLPNLRELRCPARSRQRLAGKCTNKLGVVFSEGFMCSARRNAHLWPRSTALVAVVSSCERFCRLLHAAPESARRPTSQGGRDGVSFCATGAGFLHFRTPRAEVCNGHATNTYHRPMPCPMANCTVAVFRPIATQCPLANAQGGREGALGAAITGVWHCSSACPVVGVLVHQGKLRLALYSKL